MHLPESPHDSGFFVSVVSGYWEMFKQNIGIMVAVDQLAATQTRFAALQNQFRQFGIVQRHRVGTASPGAGPCRRAVS